MAEPVSSALSSKGQVTIPKILRQQLGLSRGSRVSFELVGDHIEVRAAKGKTPQQLSSFGLLKTDVRPVPADFDPATLLQP